MPRSIRVAAAFVLGAVLLAGCTLNESKWTGDAAASVVYAKSIPLYPGATSDGTMGSQNWGDEPGSYTEGMTVWFVVDGPLPKKLVVAAKETEIEWGEPETGRAEVEMDAWLALTVAFWGAPPSIEKATLPSLTGP